MKAILINPNKKTIEIVECDGSLKDIYQLLDCETIQSIVHYSNTDTMYGNENGYGWMEWSKSNAQAGFKFPDWVYPVLGKCLIVGEDQRGHPQETTFTQESLTKLSKEIEWKTWFEMSAWGRKSGLI
jgi:hypothetical protein